MSRAQSMGGCSSVAGPGNDANLSGWSGDQREPEEIRWEDWRQGGMEAWVSLPRPKMGAGAVCESVSQVNAHQRPSTIAETLSHRSTPGQSASGTHPVEVSLCPGSPGCLHRGPAARLPLPKADLTLSFAAYLTGDEPFIWNHPLRRPTSLVELG